MKSVIAGGSGFIGNALVEALEQRGEVVVLSRNPGRVTRGRGVAWNPPHRGDWEREIDGADAIINLAGESIAAKRWSDERKEQLVSSRVEPTAALVRAIETAAQKPPVFINASATGIYGDRGDEELTEGSTPGTDFLAELAQRWEAEALKASPFTRVVLARFGVVMSRDGGMLERLLPLFRLNAGGQLGSGRQWLAWISRRDAVALLLWMIDHAAISGACNVTAPEPVTNREFTRVLASTLGRIAIFRVPSIPLRLAMGEMAEALLFSSQRAVPARALREQFIFADADLQSALIHELR